MSLWDAWSADPKYTQLINSPGFLAATPQFRHNIHDILYKYGFTPSADQNDLTGGMAVEDNPYSVAAQLKKNYATADHHSINDANAANLEESGAAAGALHANAEGYKQNVSDALASEGGEINSAVGTYTGQINDIFGGLEANPVPQVTTTPSIGGSAGNPAYGGREADRPGPVSAQPNPWHIPDANGNALTVSSKLKKTTLPGIGGMGHIT